MFDYFQLVLKRVYGHCLLFRGGEEANGSLLVRAKLKPTTFLSGSNLGVSQKRHHADVPWSNDRLPYLGPGMVIHLAVKMLNDH